MSDILIQHAINNIWCNPAQDTKNIIRPARLTTVSGTRFKFTIGLEDLLLPVNTKCHIFQIGQIDLKRISFSVGDFVITRSVWKNASVLLKEQNLFVEVYYDNGVRIPLNDVFFCITPNMNFVVCIKENKRIKQELSTENISISFYSNAFFHRTGVTSNGLASRYFEINTTYDIALAQKASVDLYKDFQTQTAFVNGFYVSEVSARTLAIGDCVEMIADSSIKRVISFPVRNLNTFKSTLDNEFKYLLTYDYSGPETIEYLDDVSFYLVDLTKPNGLGVLLHTNALNTIRMVSHRDYSVSVEHLDILSRTLLESYTDFSDARNLSIVAMIRNSGYSRELVYENNRLCDLFRLSRADRERAMLGLDSVVNNWQASVLEASGYTKIMSSDFSGITRDLVISAYGYDALSVLLAETPVKTVVNNNINQAFVSPGLYTDSTVYEYDSDGLLLGKFRHTNGIFYTCKDNRTKLIEIFQGVGSRTSSDLYGYNKLPIPKGSSFRLYLCHIDQDTKIPIDDWVDITDTDYYTVVNDEVIWSDRDFSYLLCLRTDVDFLDYEFETTMTNGILRFPIKVINNKPPFGSILRDLDIPYGEMDVFLNNRSLIENVDYFVSFPYITISNKEYLFRPDLDSQRIRIRGRGFCDKNLKSTKKEDRGYVVHGKLSSNNRYDIREDKVQRICLDGSVRHKEDLLYSETNSDLDVFNIENGRPYSIRDVIVPIGNSVGKDTYVLKQESDTITKAVSDYLSMRLPQKPIDGVSTVKRKYTVYSPFISRVINAVTSGEIDSINLGRNLSNDDFMKIIKPYEFLLKEDPLTFLTRHDRLFVEIEPHYKTTSIGVNLLQYRFINRLVKIYTSDSVDLGMFLTLEKV